jgi:DNA-binding SARP family transcriptional activator
MVTMNERAGPRHRAGATGGAEPSDVDSDRDRDLDDELRSAWRDELGDSERGVLELVLATGVSRVDVFESTAPGGSAAIAGLDRLPLVEVDAGRIHVDERWSDVVDVGPDLIRDIATQLVQALLEGPCSESDLVDAGRLALAAGDPGCLRSVIRAALSQHPPRVSVHFLRTWSDADVLPPGDPHREWLRGVCAAVRGDQLESAVASLGAARAAFDAAGDHEAEINVGLALGIAARRVDDLATLATLVVRARELEKQGEERAAHTRLLGEALLRQMGGEPEKALELLDRIPATAFAGDWAAQVLMMRGANLLLCERFEDALAQVEASTGVGSAWTYATALSLLSTTRWRQGDQHGALEDAAEAERQARRIGAVATEALACAMRAAMLGVMGHADAAEVAAAAGAHAHMDDEGRRLVQVAIAMQAVNDGQLGLAAATAAAIEPAERATLSTFWTISLQTALGLTAPERWSELCERHESLRPALRAGLAAAELLHGGKPVPRELAPYLPASWCVPAEEWVEIRLLDDAEVRRGGRRVDHPSWDRARVRELCLHLALVQSSSRELAAGTLWADRSPEAASRNLRVTLSHLLDVLDPDRPRGGGSDLVENRQGVLRFAATDRLHIDVRRAAEAARAIVAADAANDARTLLAAARRLGRERSGRFLAGGAVGDWVEPHQRMWTDLMASAVAAAAPVALDAGDPELAEDLVRRGLELDPWAERLHQLLVRARLAQDDLDGARRAWRTAVSHLEELHVRPESATLRLGRELGLR